MCIYNTLFYNGGLQAIGAIPHKKSFKSAICGGIFIEKRRKLSELFPFIPFLSKIPPANRDFSHIFVENARHQTGRYNKKALLTGLSGKEGTYRFSPVARSAFSFRECGSAGALQSGKHPHRYCSPLCSRFPDPDLQQYL